MVHDDYPLLQHFEYWDTSAQLQCVVIGNDSRHSLTWPVDYCTLYGDNTSLLSNIGNIVNVVFKSSDQKRKPEPLQHQRQHD